VNYIKALQIRERELQAELEKVEQNLNDFKAFLHSAKFVGTEDGERKDWISTGDVIRWIDNIKREIAY
jgi:hypothetical protein